MKDSNLLKLAVLIDADNAQASIIEGLLAEIAKYGIASVKRIYGDWTSQKLRSWKDSLLEYSIQPIQQFSYTTGKKRHRLGSDNRCHGSALYRGSRRVLYNLF